MSTFKFNTLNRPHIFGNIIIVCTERWTGSVLTLEAGKAPHVDLEAGGEEGVCEGEESRVNVDEASTTEPAADVDQCTDGLYMYLHNFYELDQKCLVPFQPTIKWKGFLVAYQLGCWIFNVVGLTSGNFSLLSIRGRFTYVDCRVLFHVAADPL